jgi:DNA processing protein
MNQRSIFDRSFEQKFTWQSKHIKFFLELPNIGLATVEKIIEVNPDIDQWDRDYVASQFPNYEKSKMLLPEEIPKLQNLDETIVMNYKEDRFPQILKEMTKDKPLLLWFKGNVSDQEGVAVVGSRKIIPETSEIVNSFIKQLSDLHVSIVSGLANGVDELAHLAALENNLKTIAVLPSSLDNILPKSNTNLAHEIVENGGLIVTEYGPGSPRKPENSNYISRNRIQAGLSNLIFVAQSSIPGGTMTTAKFALDYQKKLSVYKSSSNLDIEEYKGNKYLLQAINENFDFSVLKFTKKQISVLKEKKSLADFSIPEDLEEIKRIF